VKNPKLTKIVWRSIRSKFKEGAERTLRENSKDFDEEYLRELSERIVENDRLTTKLWLSNMVLLATLFLQIGDQQNELSIFGLKIPKVGEAREFILFASITLSLNIAFLNYLKRELKDTREVLLTILYADSNVRILKKAAYPCFIGDGVGKFSFPADNVLITKLGRFFGGAIVILSVVPWVLALMVPIPIQIIVALQILQDPKLPDPWNIAFEVWVIASAVGYFGIYVVDHLPFPHKDYSLVFELSKLQETDKKAHDSLMRQILQGTRKP